MTSPSDYDALMVAVCDLNGVYRGKRVPGAQLGKVLNGTVRMPLSGTSVDIWGRDIEESELVFASGDADGICVPLTDQVLPAPWLAGRSGFVPCWMISDAGAPHPADPRQALAAVVARYQGQGLTPVVATELEFYLTKSTEDDLQKPDPWAASALTEGQVLSLDNIEAMSPFLDDVYKAAEAQGIPADAAISECGEGQFEVNLTHRADPSRAADDAQFFKRLVKGTARSHGFNATFMPKPFGQSAGSGLHVHFSCLDAQGANIFDDGSDRGSDDLRAAVGGLTNAMADCTLIFAPHANSYRRLRSHGHAPTAIAWGYENRTAAIRIPGGPNAARRIEHRVAGADANPYLVLAAILGAALDGMDAKTEPPAPTTGNAYDAGAPELPTDWATAIDRFQSSTRLSNIFDPMLQRLFAQCKWQELDRFLDVVSPFETQTYGQVL